ncbi:MAG: aminotransferase class V-fold PLP-dependent enzyme, partial [Mesorhizobium sp.]
LLVAADCFPSLHFLLAGLAERFNFVLDTVPLRPGESWVRDEDFIARWQDDVGLALLTFVTSTASHRCDVARLAKHGREMGSIVGVDITQGVGVAPFSIAKTPVDFVVSTSLKWLCGTSGAGILQVAPDLLSACRPELRGWFS